MQSIRHLWTRPLILMWTAVEFVHRRVLQSIRESLISTKDACPRDQAPEFHWIVPETTVVLPVRVL